MNTNNQEKPRHSAPFVVLALLLCLTVPLMAVPASAELFKNRVFLEAGGSKIELPVDILGYDNICLLSVVETQTLYLIGSGDTIVVSEIISPGILDVNYFDFSTGGICYKLQFEENTDFNWVQGVYFPLMYLNNSGWTVAMGTVRLRGEVEAYTVPDALSTERTYFEPQSMELMIETGGDVKNGLTVGLSSMGELLTALFTPSGSLFPLSVSVGLGVGVAVISWCVKKKRMVW